jgi:hypothetical protein
LVGLCFAFVGLQIDYFCNVDMTVEMMTTNNASEPEAKTLNQILEVFE